jgi:hypothetical protein
MRRRSKSGLGKHSVRKRFRFGRDIVRIRFFGGWD